jgi:hypothetical protein
MDSPNSSALPSDRLQRAHEAAQSNVDEAQAAVQRMRTTVEGARAGLDEAQRHLKEVLQRDAKRKK